jgi:hypothetical protein
MGRPEMLEERILMSVPRCLKEKSMSERGYPSTCGHFTGGRL